MTLPQFAGLLMLIVAAPFIAGDEHASEIQKWRAEHEAKLRAEESWLTLAGLHWLVPGENSVGSGPTCRIRLPEHAPQKVGSFFLEGPTIRFEPGGGVRLTLAGEPFAGGPLRSDDGQKPDVLAVGEIRLIVIKRGERFAIRVKDNASPLRKSFRGLNWAPEDPAWRIEARFEPVRAKETIVLDTIIGTRESLECPGFAVFEHKGKTYRLQAARSDDLLWFVFRDTTAGETTSDNARQLETPLPSADGRLILDFNKAVNLPCAYTPFATCPIAPKQNRLPFPIFAGELLYKPASK